MNAAGGAVNEAPRWERRNLTRWGGFQLVMRKINSSLDKNRLDGRTSKPGKSSLVPSGATAREKRKLKEFRNDLESRASVEDTSVRDAPL
jgi:hypothetical protein